MKTIEIEIYEFSELSEDAKENAIEKLYDINVDYEWWQFAYDDAENIGLKITGFDLGRGWYCNGEFILSACEIAQNILNEHGENCETYKTANNFMKLWQLVFNEYMDENSKLYESAESENDLQYLESEFLNDLLSDYLIMLDNEYEYLTSEKAIIETIKANEYQFTVNGEIY